MGKIIRIVAVAVAVVGGSLTTAEVARAQQAILDEAQRLYFSGRFDAAADLALTARSNDLEELAASELRSSALLLQIRRAFGEPKDKEAGLKQCASCEALTTAFMAEIKRGQALARARLQANPADETARFYLGKLDLNYVWLQLGTFGRKTGWGEYWEARKSLDAVLAANPDHIRARVARAWIDYIVDTKLPRGTKWLLGGGNKKRGLQIVQAAANTETAFFVHTEATFALLDMQKREKQIPAAVATARALQRDFPDNEDLRKFLETNDATARR